MFQNTTCRCRRRESSDAQQNQEHSPAEPLTVVSAHSTRLDICITALAVSFMLSAMSADYRKRFRG